MLKSVLSVFFLLRVAVTDARLGPRLGMIALIGVAPDEPMTREDLEVFTKIGQDLLGFPIHAEQAARTGDSAIMVYIKDETPEPVSREPSKGMAETEGLPGPQRAGPPGPIMDAESVGMAEMEGLPGPQRAGPPGASPMDGESLAEMEGLKEPYGAAEPAGLPGPPGTAEIAAEDTDGLPGPPGVAPPGVKEADRVYPELAGDHMEGLPGPPGAAPKGVARAAGGEPYPDRIMAILDEWTTELVASGLPFFENLQAMALVER